MRESCRVLSSKRTGIASFSVNRRQQLHSPTFLRKMPRLSGCFFLRHESRFGIGMFVKKRTELPRRSQRDGEENLE